MEYAFARLREPSTYTALGAMLAIFGINEFPEGLAQQLAGGVAAIGVALGIFLKERASE